MPKNKGVARRALLHLGEGHRVPVEPEEVFLVEADGTDTLVRTRGRRKLRDVRPFSEVLRRFPPELFVRVHRSRAVNIDRVSEIRRRSNTRDWELLLEPPANTVVPVSREHLAALWAAYGEQD